MWRRCHANFPTGAFGSAPYGATKRVRGVPNWGGGAMRTFPLNLRWSSPWGHETCKGLCRNGAAVPCDLSHWGFRWGSLWAVSYTHLTLPTILLV
eukprot:652139-Pyramimonas_sp.AAC.1